MKRDEEPRGLERMRRIGEALHDTVEARNRLRRREG